MDFFGRQDQARRTTRKLVGLFLLGVLCTVLLVNLLTYVVVNGYIANRTLPRDQVEAELGTQTSPMAVHWNAQIIVSVLTLSIITIGTLYKLGQLSGGGSTVAVSMGGRPARPDSDAKERQLVNIVEEMSLASGVPMPQVYVLEREKGINAFAAGLTQHDAVVAVTQGALTEFTRDEMQGVIAHEFSHVLNGDMRINLRMIAVLHGLLVIALTGQVVLRMAFAGSHVRSSRDRGGGALAILGIGLAMIVIGSIGYFFGQIIKAAISRNREYLADASAVQFTRNPNGIASALKRLGSNSRRSRLYNENAAETSHMCIGNSLNSAWFGFMSTHPPLEDRIRAIDPSWDGTFPTFKENVEEPATKPPTQSKSVSKASFGADQVASQIGRFTPEQVGLGAALLAAVPAAVREATHTSYSARAVVLALALAGEEELSLRLPELMGDKPDLALVKEVRKMQPRIAQLTDDLRLAAIECCLPALAQLTDSQKKPFLKTLDNIVKADNRIDPAEYCLTRLIQVHLSPPGRGQNSIHAVRPLLPSAAIVLSALARFGSNEEKDIQTAFAVGAGKLLQSGMNIDLLSADNCGPEALDKAIDHLRQASPGIKRRFINACAYAIAADGVVHPRETELLRLLGMLLDTPLPLMDQPGKPAVK